MRIKRGAPGLGLAARFALALVFFSLFPAAILAAPPRALTLEERAKALEAVERVYHARRIWPQDNPIPRPPLETVLSEGTLRCKVEDALLKSGALEAYYGVAIDAGRLQGELDRMARDTHSPEVLRELFAALGDDPYLAAEVLARPALADRLLREKWRESQGLDEEAVDDGFDAWWAAVRGSCRDPGPLPESAFRLPEVPLDQCQGDSWGTISTSGQPTYGSGYMNPVWTGSEALFWATAGCHHRYDPATDTWSVITAVGAPTYRDEHAGVWSGTEMIIWGGSNSSYVALNTGGRYNPASDSWTLTTTSGAPAAMSSPTAVWSGTCMVVGDGFYAAAGTWGRYYPATDSWSSASIPPNSLRNHRVPAAWTGSRMLVWGEVGSTPAPGGGRYDPASDGWTAMSGTGGPTWSYMTGVWTGTKWILWGGYDPDAGSLVSQGSAYNPASDSWSPISTGLGCPSARMLHQAAWTGREMIVWGGRVTESPLVDTNTGGEYDPKLDTWLPTAIQGAPAPTESPNLIWTGSQVIVWPPYLPGGLYCVCTTGPAAFAATSPPDGDIVCHSPTLSWAPAAGAVEYDVWLDGVLTSDHQGLQATSCPAGSVALGDHTWNVVARNKCGTASTSSRTFHLDEDPDLATGPSPADGSTVCGTPPLSWSPAAGADTYTVYIDGTARCIDILLTTCTPPGQLADGAHTWRVNPKNSCGSIKGTYWSFTKQPGPGTASAPSPADGSTACQNPVTLSWTAAPDTTAYDVYLDGALKCSDVAGTSCGAGSVAAGPHAWYVVCKSAGCSTTGPTWSFQSSSLPAQPAGPSPANGASVCGNPTLSWSAAARASTYTVYVDGVAKCAGITGTTCSPGETADGSHTWRVDATNACGTTTGASWGFTKSTTPGAASSPSPLNNALVCQSSSFTLAWSAAPSASSYDVYLDGALKCGATAGTSCLAGTLSEGQHTWYVTAKAGSCSTAGPTWTFTVLTLPSQASSPAPADGGSACGTPTLSWSAASHATSYTVYVDGTAKCTAITDTTCNPGTLSNGSHSWRVDAGGLCGTTTGTTWHFTQGSQPGTASGPTPADGASFCGVSSVMLKWTAAAGATSYDVYLDGALKCSDVTIALQCSTGTLGGGQHSWYVVAKSGGCSTTGPTWSFTTRLIAPVKPHAPSPADGASGVCGVPVLSWTSGAGGTFDVYVDGALVCSDTTQANCQPSVLASGLHQWRVDATNACGTTTGDTWTFTNDATPPDTAGWDSLRIVEPRISTGTMLSWEAVEGAATYAVYRDTRPDSPWAPVERIALGLTDTSFSDRPPALSPGGVYFYMVTAADTCGNSSP